MSKAGKRRLCPAVKREISRAECGENRGSRYACPPECPFNPFAPASYSQLLELEMAIDREMLNRLTLDTNAERAMRRATQAHSPVALHAALVWHIYFARDAQGLTSAQRWERAGFPGLKNDQRVVARAKMGLTIVLFEVRRVIDRERTEVVDLLSPNPKPFIIADRGLAASAVRFATGLTWTYALPHFHRIFGNAILLQEVSLLDPREVVEEIVRHLGGPTDEPGMRRWLAEHLPRVEAALKAVGMERRRLMFEGVDIGFGKAVYELQAPFAQCCDRLDELGEVEKDQLEPGERQEGFADARVWFAGEDDRELAKSVGSAAPVLGRVLLGQAHWRLETIGSAKLATLRERFEWYMGARVKFGGERFDNYGESMAEKEGKADYEGLTHVNAAARKRFSDCFCWSPGKIGGRANFRRLRKRGP